MKVIICFLQFLSLSFAYEAISPEKPHQFQSFMDEDVSRNSRQIRKIFEKTATINILMRNFDHPSGIVNMFEDIFGGNGNKSFVVFNFLSESYKNEWMNECREYLSNPGHKIAYHERVYKKSYGDLKPSKGFKFEDEFVHEPDPQADIPTFSTSVKVQEEFAKKLDCWRFFYVSGYIVFSSSFDLELFIGCAFNRFGTFLFIIDDPIAERDEGFMEMIKLTFSNAWTSTNNFKLYILVKKEIVTFNPFERDEDGLNFGKTHLFDEDNVLSEEKLMDLNGYPLRIEMFNSVFSTSADQFVSLNFSTYRGPDFEAARLLTQKMNLTTTLVRNEGKFGGKYPNGTLTGALGNLQRRKSDIALTAFFMKDYETKAAEFTYPLYMDRLCVVVKKAGRIPSELLPMVIFTENLWIAHFLVCFLIATIWMLLRTINNRIRRPSIDGNRHVDFHISNYNMSPFLARQSRLRHGMQIFVDTLMLYLSIPMRRLTRVQYERHFVASICLVSIIFVSIYQSSLATVFVRPLYFKDIDTLEKLDKSINNIYVKYAGFLTDVFPNDTSQLYRNLRNKMKLVETKIDSMDLVKDNEKVATITRESTTWLENFLYFYQNVLYIIDKDCPKEYFLAYMVPAKSPFLERFNEILLDFQGFGFINKWINDFYYETEILHLETMSATANVQAAKVLSMIDLKFPFFALFGGSCLSSAAFVVEFIYMLIQRRTKRNGNYEPKQFTLQVEPNQITKQDSVEVSDDSQSI